MTTIPRVIGKSREMGLRCIGQETRQKLKTDDDTIPIFCDNPTNKRGTYKSEVRVV